MGIKDFFLKGKTNQAGGGVAEMPLNLTKEQSVQTLNLRKETLGTVLLTKNLGQTVARVVVAMDNSGSMSDLYRNGTVQSVIERLLPIAMKFDDNGELDMYLFSGGSIPMKGITEHDFFGYVDREVMSANKRGMWGGTNYAPVMKDIVREYAVSNPSNIPTFVIYLTDGENFDKEEATRTIVDASKYNIFWQFVGIGNEQFKFLQKLDDLEGRTVDNADFFPIRDINKMSDQELYSNLLNEFPSWLQAFSRL